MTPHFVIQSFGPKIGSVDGICHQTDSMNIFYLVVKTGPYGIPPEFHGGVRLLSIHIMYHECSSTYTNIYIYFVPGYHDISSAVIMLRQFGQ